MQTMKYPWTSAASTTPQTSLQWMTQMKPVVSLGPFLLTTTRVELLETKGMTILYNMLYNQKQIVRNSISFQQRYLLALPLWPYFSKPLGIVMFPF